MARWTCPKCGRRLSGRNQWHSCVVAPLGRVAVKGKSQPVQVCTVADK